MSTYLTPVAWVPYPHDNDLTKEEAEKMAQTAVCRILTLMLQDQKPVHLAYGFPMEGDRVEIVRDDCLPEPMLKIGVEVALDRCDDIDYQTERCLLVKRAVMEYLAK